MKKITLLLLLFLVSFSVKAQFPEDFETAVPPTGWVTFIGTNGEGTVQDWTTTTTAASGSQAAKVRYENVTNAAEDWLVTPQFTPTAAANILTFKQRQDFGSDYGTTYTIRVSTTASQMTHADFAIIDTQSETDFGTSYTTHNVNLSAYDGVPIYVAFVMNQDDGDSWLIDDVDVVLNASPPNCATDPSPADTVTGVAITGGNVTISWVAPVTGDAATDYEVFFGTTSGALTSLGTVSGLTTDITNINFSTTYYWMVIPQNNGGSATGCAEWSFMTEAAPPPPANDECSTAIGLTVNTDLACGTTTAGSNAFATASTQDDDAGGTPNNDVWFTFVATDTSHNISLLNKVTVVGTSTDMAMSVFDDLAGCSMVAANQVGESDPDSFTVSGLTINDTYYVRVYGWTTAQINFDICIGTLPPPPANDECAGAIALTINTSEAGSTAGATGASSTSCDGTIGNDVWYTVVGDGGDLAISVDSPSEDSQIGVFESNDCSGITLGTCDFSIDPFANPVELTFPSVVGTKYYIQVGAWLTSGDPSDFDIVVTTSLSVEDNLIEGFSIYPNPVTDVLNFRALDNIKTISIYNLLGQEVLRGQPNVSNTQIDMTDIPTGMYVVKVQVGEQLGSYRVVKQ